MRATAAPHAEVCLTHTPGGRGKAPASEGHPLMADLCSIIVLYIVITLSLWEEDKTGSTDTSQRVSWVSGLISKLPKRWVTLIGNVVWVTLMCDVVWVTLM